ncbi:MAG: acyltransferase [Lacunisphaera sp.]|nr:acyltransferase [Lacunisphaera sp.]
MSIEKPQDPAALSAGRQPRSRAIDLLRGTAILLVIGCHYVVAPGSAGMLTPVAQLWYRIGWAGVDLFFVLSGFLVSGLLFAEFQRHQRVDMKRFLVRRGLKIWPAYFAYLLFLAGWLLAHRSKGSHWEDLWPNLLHLQNYFGSPRVHTWSLAVEEHFYLVAAAVWTLFLTPRRIGGVHRLFPIVAVFGLLAVALARQLEFARGGRESLNLFATHLRFDGLLMGTLLAYLTHFVPERMSWCRQRPWACLAAGVLLAAPVLWLTPDHDAGSAGAGLGLMYVGFALVVLGVINLEQPAQRSRHLFATLPARALARMGVFSYGIYLWHVDLAQTPMKKIAALVANAHLPGWATWLGVTALYVAFAFLVGAMMSRLIEMPVLALRDRLFPSKTGLAQPVPAASTLPVEAVAGRQPLARTSSALGT